MLLFFRTLLKINKDQKIFCINIKNGVINNFVNDAIPSQFYSMLKCNTIPNQFYSFIKYYQLLYIEYSFLMNNNKK